MKWIKLGKIFEVNNYNYWLVTHSAIPFVKHLQNDVFRIYFSVRNKFNQSQPGFFDFDLINMKIVNQLTKEPLLTPGFKGSYDDAGVVLSCYCNDNDLFYYMAYNIPENVPFNNQIGAAYFQGDALVKHTNNPILGKCEKEPYSFGCPWVLKVNEMYYMWYDTNLFWNMENPMQYKFEIRSAISKDGIKWDKTFQTGMSLEANERAIGRPCVIYEDEIFKMWYSLDTNGKYSIGYAESDNGINWVRKDNEVGIHRSKEGWDSEEIEYPCVFNHKDNKYMLYNGNGYGKTGIGLAILENNGN
jgi:hypothetical protein